MKLIVAFVGLAVLYCANAAVVRMGLKGRRPPHSRTEVRGQRTMNKATVVEPLEPHDVLFTATISLGTPPQSFETVVDTSFASFGVYDSSCEDCAPERALFKSGDSSTYTALTNKTFDISITRYPTKGFLGLDTFRFGEGLSLSNQFIAQGQHSIPRIPFADGILGLAIKPNYGSFVPPFSRAASSGGLLDFPLYTLYLDNSGGHSGQITYGGLDNDHCGKVLGHAPLSSGKQWRFNVKSLTVGGYSNNVENEALIINVKKNIGLPKEIYEAVMQEIGASTEDKSVDCEKELPNLKFTVGELHLEVPKDKYVVKNEESGQCFVALEESSQEFQSEPYQKLYLLGLPFSYTYCTVHELGMTPQVGFALHKEA